MRGFINLLKPPGLSSHDMVSIIRRELNVKKAGHGGTLDPGAAGVLVIAIGRATRLLEFAVESEKKYRAEITFGISTNTGDAFGEITSKKEGVVLTRQQIEEALDFFTGEISQIPPMASAVKFKGKKLYEYARKGIEIERKARIVKIFNLKLVYLFNNADHPRAIIDITCSKGTYVRSLLKDIGDFLGCGAYMSFLVRTSVGNFNLKDSLTIEEIASCVQNKDFSFIKPIDVVMGDYKKIIVENSSLSSVLNGAPLKPKDEIDRLDVGDIVRLYDKEGNFIAVAKIDARKMVKPVKVFKT